jgi:rod shape-determining protein MreC
MGKLIIGDFMKKKKKKKNFKTKERILLILILFLILFSYFELNGDIRLGKILNDLLFIPTRTIKNEELFDSINIELKQENEDLKKLLNINYSLSDFDIFYATVVERNNTYWLNDLLINKGKNDGLEEDIPVVDENGLIGIIESCGRLTSKIKLITDLKYPISIKINNNYKLLTIDKNKLVIRGINNKDKIKIGDKVLTSGLQDKLPKGILVGTIRKIGYESNGVGLIAEVELSANIDDIRFVAILKRVK